jgi:hypothetical protein
MHDRNFVGESLQPIVPPHGYYGLRMQNSLALSYSPLESRMGNAKSENDRQPSTDQSGESELRGDALTGSEQKRAVDHTAGQKARNPDTVLNVDNEEDTLYSDGLELEDDTPPLGTDRDGDNAR